MDKEVGVVRRLKDNYILESQLGKLTQTGIFRVQWSFWRCER